MKLACLIVVALGSLASFAVAPTAQEARPLPDTIIDLGSFGGPHSFAFDVNDRLQVIGTADDLFQTAHPFLWENGVMRRLTDPSGADVFDAADINNRGQIVVAVTDLDGVGAGAIWEDGRVTLLPLPPSALGCGGTAINDHGDVAGVCSAGLDFALVAVVWTRKGGIRELPPPSADEYYQPTAINDRGVVVGNILTRTGLAGAFVWHDGVVTRLNGFETAEDVNDHGQITGMGRRETLATTALLLDRGRLMRLPGLTSLGPEEAHAINDHGEIAGASGDVAVVWERGRPRALSPLPGGFDAFAFDINNRGAVVGGAENSQGFFRAVLWPRAAAHTPAEPVD